jgi:hypothetical protein
MVVRPAAALADVAVDGGEGLLPRINFWIARRRVLPACQMIFHVIGDLLTDRRQLNHILLDARIVGLLG